MTEIKTLALDETLNQLVCAVKSNNSCQREIRDILSNKLGTGFGERSVFIVPATYDGASYVLKDVGFDDIKSSVNEDLMPILVINYLGVLYIIPYSEAKTGTGTEVTSYKFPTDRFCPDGAPGMFSITKSGSIVKSDASSASDDSKNIVIRLGEQKNEAAILERLRLVYSASKNLQEHVCVLETV